MIQIKYKALVSDSVGIYFEVFASGPCEFTLLFGILLLWTWSLSVVLHLLIRHY